MFYVVLPFELEDIISEVEYPMKLKHVRTHKVFPITFQERSLFLCLHVAFTYTLTQDTAVFLENRDAVLILAFT